MTRGEIGKTILKGKSLTMNDRTYKPGPGNGFVGYLVPMGNRQITQPGAGQSRIWSCIKAGYPFVQLTAFRSHLPEKVNRERNHEMFQAFRAFGFCGLRMLGVWEELDRETGIRTPVDEDSLFIPLTEKSQLTGNELAELAMMMSHRYNQDVFLYGDGKTVYGFYLRDQTIEWIDSYDTIDTHDLEYGWSRVQSNKEKVKIDPETRREVAKLSVGDPWSYLSEMTAQAVPAGSYIASLLAGTHKPNSKFGANDFEDIPGKLAGEVVPRQVREGFRFEGYYYPINSISAMLMLRAGTLV
jgi:hypothetical protein